MSLFSRLIQSLRRVFGMGPKAIQADSNSGTVNPTPKGMSKPDIRNATNKIKEIAHPDEPSAKEIAQKREEQRKELRKVKREARRKRKEERALRAQSRRSKKRKDGRKNHQNEVEQPTATVKEITTEDAAQNLTTQVNERPMSTSETDAGDGIPMDAELSATQESKTDTIGGNSPEFIEGKTSKTSSRNEGIEPLESSKNKNGKSSSKKVDAIDDDDHRTRSIQAADETSENLEMVEHLDDVTAEQAHESSPNQGLPRQDTVHEDATSITATSVQALILTSTSGGATELEKNRDTATDVQAEIKTSPKMDGIAVSESKDANAPELDLSTLPETETVVVHQDVVATAGEQDSADAKSKQLDENILSTVDAPSKLDTNTTTETEALPSTASVSLNTTQNQTLFSSTQATTTAKTAVQINETAEDLVAHEKAADHRRENRDDCHDEMKDATKAQTEASATINHDHDSTTHGDNFDTTPLITDGQNPSGLDAESAATNDEDPAPQARTSLLDTQVESRHESPDDNTKNTVEIVPPERSTNDEEHTEIPAKKLTLSSKLAAAKSRQPDSAEKTPVRKQWSKTMELTGEPKSKNNRGLKLNLKLNRTRSSDDKS